MAKRKTDFAIGEFYHVYNRGVDKRNIFEDQHDLLRFSQSVNEFNTEKPIGSIYENQFSKNNSQLGSEASKLVEFICYCINPNHFHFVLKQQNEDGIAKFMQRLGTGYTKYFNNRHQRSGALFQGNFKAVHVDSNEYLLHLSAYVNLNGMVHNFDKRGGLTSKSSMGEYLGGIPGICEKEIILGQFKNTEEYKKFAESSLKDILQRRGIEEEKCPREYFLE